MWLVRPRVMSAMSSVAAQSQTWAQLRWSRLRTTVARPAAVTTVGHSNSHHNSTTAAASASATRGCPDYRARGIHGSSKSAAAGSGRACHILPATSRHRRAHIIGTLLNPR